MNRYLIFVMGTGFGLALSPWLHMIWRNWIMDREVRRVRRGWMREN